MAKIINSTKAKRERTMRKTVLIGLIIFTVLLGNMLNNGCIRITNPSEQDILGVFKEEKNSFEIISQYLKDLEYSSCFINKDNGEFFAEFNYHNIDSNIVVGAIKRLWKKGCTHISKDDEKNSISFVLWHNDHEMVAGLLICIRENENAQVEFMTEIKKTYFSSWYYFVSDYNKWRISRTK